MRVAVLQMTSSDQPAENLATVLDAIEHAGDCDLLLTPEVTNCVSKSKPHQDAVLENADQNHFLQSVQKAARAKGIWVLLGSLAVKTDRADGRFANRSFLVSDQGDIAAWYDKIHMFDVTLPQGEVYHESKNYAPGDRAVLAHTPFAQIGMTICYDVRFAHLYRDLAKAGAQVLCVPSAFAVPTGRAHWHSLLRARAIETGCYVIAPAQTGVHPGSDRCTFGHSLIIDPWGQVILDAGEKTGLHIHDLDLNAVDKARARVPSLEHDRPHKIVT
ncbi:MAG: carbon-nitrogen hydrolase family protein [Planktomarina sp.]